MSKKPLGKDKFGVQKVMRVKDYFGDATGQFALNAMSTLVGQLTYSIRIRLVWLPGRLQQCLLSVRLLTHLQT